MFDIEGWGGGGSSGRAGPPDGAPTAEDEAFIASLEAEWAATRGAEPWDVGWDQAVPPYAADDLASPGRRVPTARELQGQPGGGPLADLLASAEPASMDEYALVELVAAWTRLTSWSQAAAAGAAAALARRSAMAVGAEDTAGGVPTDQTPSPPGRRHARSVRCVAAHELAMRLCISRDAAQRMIDTGRALAGPLAPVGDAFASGEIDQARARAFVEGLAGTPLPVAAAVQDQVLPRAGRRTSRQVARDIAEALISIDPDEATQRHRRARERRHVTHPVALPDGMAGIWAVLPAVDAVALDTALDGAAAAARASGDPRTRDQVRADALAVVGHSALACGWIGAPPAGAGSPADEDGRVRVGAVGGRPPQIRVTVPLAALLPDDAVGSSTAEPGDPLEAEPGDRPAAVPELERYGPVTPDVARALALGGVWTRLVTDPSSGVVRDVGRTRYRPPTELAELVRARDRTCTRPGCHAHATGCDLDHTIPYHLGGRTSEGNLGALCSTDHAMKSAGGFTVLQRGPGVFEFQLPSGHAYRREADGTATLLPRRDDPCSPPF